MIVTVFRSRLMPGFKDEYVALVDRMQEIARSIPGYISHKGFWSDDGCLLYTSPSPRDRTRSRMPSSA